MPKDSLDTNVWAIVVAAGVGRRFGSAKQFLELQGKTVLERSIAAARSVADYIVAVVPAAVLSDASLHGGADVVVAGGRDRTESVRAGLGVVPADAKIIIVHDAARPLASPRLFHLVVAAITSGADGAVPGVSLTDTVKRVNGQTVVETLNREQLVTVQTPQAFRAEVLRSAYALGKSATDDAALVESGGGQVVVVLGESRNMKLTDPRDLAVAIRYLHEMNEGATS
jgi:2-C-methyl-D-erythritol 4-phosphate cytidylyltransferase